MSPTAEDIPIEYGLIINIVERISSGHPFDVPGVSKEECDMIFTAGGGAVLIFMPGFQEIDMLMKGIRQRKQLNGKVKVFPCHSSLSTEQQRQVDYFHIQKIYTTLETHACSALKN